MRIKSNIVLSDGRWRVYKGGRGASKIISSDTWYEEIEDFSRAAIGTERKTHKEERGVELLQGGEIFQGVIIMWMFGKPLWCIEQYFMWN